MVSATLPRFSIVAQVHRLNRIAGVGSPATAFRLNTKKFTGLELQLNEKMKAAEGLKEFWKTNLPTLKFHNDDFGFRVTKIQLADETEEVKCPVKLKVFGVDQKDNFELDCKSKPRSLIFEEFIKHIEAKQVPEEEIPVLSTRPSDKKKNSEN
ncbi:MRP49 [[Candida] subhashii]|uniref:MRP49 n=1 Tax=[Candida] subhashii TaxID=561895 RepID=A0A8J5QD80_9ASCO|nr:MRP49 [[Candida] subhashii]KAG7660613.1 MRP49 [[Candida] subhashii]